jgi:hypothetical protein
MQDHHTTPMFLESVEDAFKEAVRCMGGAKTVGVKMRPEKLATDAGRWLSDCLNPDTRDKLSLEQAMWILREARKIGCHSAINFICGDSGYDSPRPIEPENEQAKLMREFIEATKQQSRNVERMEQLSRMKVRAVA